MNQYGIWFNGTYVAIVKADSVSSDESGNIILSIAKIPIAIFTVGYCVIVTDEK